MCLALAGWQIHPHYRLVLAANRDEFHARPAAAADYWPHNPHMVAGRDLQAGGTWLGVDTQRRFGVVTNFRDLARPHRNAPSRGRFIPDFLGSSDPAEQFLARIEVDAPAYAGFSLLLGDHSGLWYASNRSDVFARRLDPGVYGLANHLLDTPWPKLVRTRTALRDWLQQQQATSRLDPEPLFVMLADRHPAEVTTELQPSLPQDWVQALSAPFVNHQGYGTRCTTVLLIDNSGRVQFRERRFDSQGQIAGDSAYTWPPA